MKYDTPGLDVPMLDPIIIPEGFSQSYDQKHGRWVITPDNYRVREQADPKKYTYDSTAVEIPEE